MKTNRFKHKYNSAKVKSTYVLQIKCCTMLDPLLRINIRFTSLNLDNYYISLVSIQKYVAANFVCCKGTYYLRCSVWELEFTTYMNWITQFRTISRPNYETCYFMINNYYFEVKWLNVQMQVDKQEGLR